MAVQRLPVAAILELEREGGVVAAAAHGRYLTLKLLLRAKADPNARSDEGDGQTALHRAVAARHHGCAKLLLRSKADPRLGSASSSPLIACVTSASDDADVVLVRQLVRAGAEVNAVRDTAPPEKAAHTALLVACLREAESHCAQRLGLVDVLLALGADPTRGRSKSVLERFIRADRTDLMSACLATEPLRGDEQGALCAALLYQKESAVRALVEAKADVDTTYLGGDTGFAFVVRGAGFTPPVRRAAWRWYLKAGCNPWMDVRGESFEQWTASQPLCRQDVAAELQARLALVLPGYILPVIALCVEYLLVA